MRYIIYLGNSHISWSSKKQLSVSRSLSEDEYRALATTTCEIQWLTFLLDDLKVIYKRHALLYCDNQSAIQMTSNQVMHERTKHGEIDYHIVRENISVGHLKLLDVASNLQLVDILTKILSATMF